MTFFHRWRSAIAIFAIIILWCILCKRPLIAYILDRTACLIKRVSGKLCTKTGTDNSTNNDRVADTNTDNKSNDSNNITIQNKTVIQDMQSSKQIKKQKTLSVIDKFVEKLRSEFPEIEEEMARKLFPRKYERHDHVLVMRLNEDVSVEEMTKVAKWIAHSFLPIKISVILCDENGIHGELRVPKLSLLFADSEQAEIRRRDYLQQLENKLFAKQKLLSVREATKQHELKLEKYKNLKYIIDKHCNSLTFALHVENNIKYYFDVSKIMFCSGNTTERMHFGTIDALNEIIVDMFAGIGYFTLPLAKHCISCDNTKIYAIEKNVESAELLKINSIANDVIDKIEVITGDNREVCDELCGKCDRVIMGYIPSCETFLPRAISFLKTKIPKSFSDEQSNNNILEDHRDKNLMKSENSKHKKCTAPPIGTVHYHFLSPKHQAKITLELHLSRTLASELLNCIDIIEIRCVKSYAPQLYHHVADIRFGECGLI